jgi:hypothetical protein
MLQFHYNNNERGHTLTILIASEVLENRALSIAQPYMYRKATTYLLACTICANNYLEIFAKDADFTKFTCEECW